MKDDLRRYPCRQRGPSMGVAWIHHIIVECPGPEDTIPLREDLDFVGLSGMSGISGLVEAEQQAPPTEAMAQAIANLLTSQPLP